MSGDHLEQIEHFLSAYREDSDEELIANPIAYHWLTVGALRAAAAELKRLRAQRLSLDGQVFISGWYAHAEACASLGWDLREAAWRKCREEMVVTLAKAAPQQPAPTVAELHARFAHPGYEYATTQGSRKAFDAINEPPEGAGWERNIDAGRPGEGWERFDYHEESYWRRLRPDATSGFPSCGHPEHQSAFNSKGGDEQ